MTRTYLVLVRLIALGVVLQGATVAMGWFLVLNDVDGGAVLTKDTDYNGGQIAHAIIGMMVMPVLALVLIVVALLSKLPGAAKYGGLLLLAVVVQVLLAFASWQAPVVGLLHGANAFVILALAVRSGMAVKRAGTQESPAV